VKWIGQHIVDLIARFRSDVYLEDISTGTIASGSNLGLDSNNKIVKADVDGDITSVVAGTGLSGGGIKGDVTLNIEAAQSTVTSLGTLTALQVDQLNMNGHAITSSAEIELAPHAGASVLNIISDDVLIVSSTDQKPAVEIKSTLNTSKPPSLTFTKDKGAAGADDDFIGVINFNSDNDAQQIETFAQISGTIEAAADGGEEGKIEIGVSAKSGGSGNDSANVITGVGNGSSITDVTIGLGATGTTTIAGTLTMGSTAFVNNSGVVQVATQGTIDHDSLANFDAREHYRWDLDNSSVASINAANIPTLNQSTTGQAGTVATIAGLAPNTATTAAAQPNITSLGTLTAGLSIGGASYTGDGVSVTGSPSDDTYDVFIGKRKYPRITLIDDAASGDTEFQIWNLGDELRIGTNASNHTNAALVIHAGNAALVEVQDDLLVNDDLTVSGQIELGHASDTTIARSAAGTVTIEGETVITAATLGYHGSATRIKILPKDFMPDDSGRPVMIEDDTIPNSIFLFSNSSANMYAYVDIPTGFKATHVKIEGSDTSQHFSVYEGSIDAKAITQKGADTDIGTEADITDVTSSTTNYLVIRVESNGTSDQIFGGYVTIAAV